MGSLHLFLIDINMKSLITLSLVVVFAELSFQFYSPPIQKAAPEPVCRQVPKEVCNQVPKTSYESVTKKQCRNVPDTVCADVQERKCQIPRGLSKRLFLVSSVDFSSEKTAKLLRIQGSNVTQFKMSNVTTSLRLFMRRNAQLNTTKSVATLSRIDVTLSRKRS